MQYTLTVYREDDATVWFEVGTDPAHPAPYLHAPGEIDVAEVDFLEGRATIGQANLRVIDPQTGATQAERWLTERLGVPAGESGAGHTALVGRRALLVRDGSTIVLDGVVYSVTLSESLAGFALSLRDIRERERKTKLFTRSGTASVLPRGVVAGYGRLPSGEWLVPPTTPLRATFRRLQTVLGAAGYFDLSALWRGEVFDGSGVAPASLVVTEAMRRATRSVNQQIDLGGGVVLNDIRYPDVQVWWRPIDGPTWTIVADVQPPGVLPHPLLLNTARGKLAGDEDTSVEAVYSIGVSTFLGTLPADGEQVEVMIVYVGAPSEDYPLHFEGTAGELLRAIYRGDYSETPPGIRYDEAAVLALTTPVRLRITEPVEDARRWLEEHVYRALGAAPALDPQGRVSPVRAALPDPDAVLPTIAEANAVPIPGWEHRSDRAITVVRLSYPRDYRVPAEQDPTGEQSAGDGIASREVVIERRAPDWAIGLLGEQVHEIDGAIFRALGGPDGEPATGDVTDETGAQVALARVHETLDRWLFGGQVSSCRIRAADFPGLRVGGWVIDARSWRPNYRTRQRGGSTLAQVMAIRATDPAWLDVTLVDAGPAEQPVQPPTLGTLSVDDEGVVSVPVTAVPVDGEAAVYYAISPTQPPTDSGLWTFLGRLAAPGTLKTPPLPAGVTVWVRARGEAPGRRPSQYTTPVSITVPLVPRVSEVRLEITGGTPVVSWRPSTVTAGVRIYYAVHDPAMTPTLSASIDVVATAGTATIPAVVLGGEAITVEVEPWSGWTGSAVTGTAGPRVRKSAALPRLLAAPMLDEDDGRLYLFPHLLTAQSYRYRVDTDESTSAEVDAQPVQTADRVLVHTFTQDGERIWVGVRAYEQRDGTGTASTLWNLPYTYRAADDRPTIQWLPIVPSAPGREAVRLVAKDDADQVALYVRTYVRGSAPPAFGRVPATGFAADPLVYDVEVEKPAEGAPPMAIEAYAEDAAGNLSAHNLYLEIDGDALPSGWLDVMLDEGSGEIYVVVNTIDTDTGSFRLRANVAAIGAGGAFLDPTFADATAGEIAGGPSASAWPFGEQRKLSNVLGAGYRLELGQAVYLTCLFFRTADTSAAAQSVSTRSAPGRVARGRQATDPFLTQWSREYTVSATQPAELLGPTGEPLDPTYGYIGSARNVDNASLATLFFTLRYGDTGWSVNLVSSPGCATGGEPDVFIDGAGRPSVKLCASTTAARVRVVLERSGGAEPTSGSLDSLADVTISSPAAGQILAYDGAEWVNTSRAVLGQASVSGYAMPDENVLGLLTKHISAHSAGHRLAAHVYVDQTQATSGSIQGLEAFVRSSHAAGTLAAVYGLIANLEHSGAGVVSVARAIRAGGVVSAGTVADWRGVEIVAPTIVAGQVQTIYGLYVGQITGGSAANWAIYTDGTTPSRLGALQLGQPLEPQYGGTGLGSYSAGDLLYATGSGTLARLPAGADGQLLAMSDGTPAWQTVADAGVTLDALADVTISTPTDGQILSYAGGQWINNTPQGGGLVLGTGRAVNTGLGLTGGGTLGVDRTIAIDTAVVPRKDATDTISARWTFAAGVSASGGGTFPLDVGGRARIKEQLDIDYSAGQPGLVAPTRDGTLRWRFGSDGATESGGNTGSRFAVFAYSDAGAYLFTLLEGHREDSSDPLWIRAGGALRQVLVGPPDSGGTGYRLLRVSN